jgi:hypothetical protein
MRDEAGVEGLLDRHSDGWAAAAEEGETVGSP